MRKLETIWEFKTKNFTVLLDAVEDFDLDLSFDEDGSVRRDLERGNLVAFGVVCRVFCRGIEVGGDSLWGCVYKTPAEFRDHIGSKGEWRSYFTDLVSESIKDARKQIGTLKTVPVHD